MTTADARLLAACLLLHETGYGSTLKERVEQEKLALQRIHRLEDEIRPIP